MVPRCWMGNQERGVDFNMKMEHGGMTLRSADPQLERAVSELTKLVGERPKAQKFEPRPSRRWLNKREDS